jgi:subtilisin family serine protease
MRESFVLLILLGLWGISASPAERKPNLLFWEQAHRYYKLDEQAYTLVGLPFSSDTSNVTVVIIDGWDDGHGQTVEAIIRRGAQNANIWRMDFVFQSASCPTDPLGAYINCVQNVIADLVEAAAAQRGLTIVNMSLGLYYSNRGYYYRLLEEKGCDYSKNLNLESLKRIAKAIREAQPDKIFVAAAGNYGTSRAVGFPACLERVYSTSALKREAKYDPQNLRLAPYSNYSLIGRSYAQPIGGVMLGMGGWELEGTSFAAPLLTALLANIVSLCYQEPTRLNPSMMTREGMGVATIWSGECAGF